MSIPYGDAVALTRALVRIDSRNPSLAADGPGEGEVARLLAHVLREWGFQVELRDVVPGRPNVIARIGRPSGRSVMLNGHLDVVSTEGMVHAPFDAFERDGRMYGRGATDMKGGVAAMCAAAARIAQDAGGTPNGEIIIAAVIDEEFMSLGTTALIESGVRADMAIVTEPTRLAICPAHRGFVRAEIEFHGRAAHGSRYDIGIDSITHAGHVLVELDRWDRDVLPTRTHPLLGRASMHAGRIRGGTSFSMYPAHCWLELERRTIPSETTDGVVAEFQGAIDRVRERIPTLQAALTVRHAQPPSDVAADAPVVRSLGRAIESVGVELRIEGMPAWTDAALLNDAGIPAVCFGPGDIGLAHAPEEYVSIREIERATDVLTAFVARAMTA